MENVSASKGSMMSLLLYAQPAAGIVISVTTLNQVPVISAILATYLKMGFATIAALWSTTIQAANQQSGYFSKKLQ